METHIKYLTEAKVDHKLRDKAYHKRMLRLMGQGYTHDAAAEKAEYELKKGQLDKLMKQLKRH